MFAKCCLAQLPRGKATRKGNASCRRTIAERWIAGERATLWEEVPRIKQRCGRPGKKEADDDLEHRQRTGSRHTGSESHH
jgi:hypothetical protein